jgi:hypothetical protein
MKVKLTHEHKWIVESDEIVYDVLEIITPNNHKILKVMTDNLFDFALIPVDSVFKEFEFSESEILELTNICPFHEVMYCKSNLSHFWCPVKQVLAPIPKYENSFGKVRHALNTFHCNLIEYVLEYDRKCENTKALQIISETCLKVGGMTDLLEFTRGIVNMVKEDSKNK